MPTDTSPRAHADVETPPMPPSTPRRVIPLLTRLASYQDAIVAFSMPLTLSPDCLAVLPLRAQATVLAASAWDERCREGFACASRRSVFRRGYDIGVAFGDAIRLQRGVRTWALEQWALAASATDVQAFESWRSAFFARCDALAALATEGLIAADLAMPEDGVLRMAVVNPLRLGRLIGGRLSVFILASVYATLVCIAVRERDFSWSFAVRQLRRAGIPMGVWRARRIRHRLHRRAGRELLTSRHTDVLLQVDAEMRDRDLPPSLRDQLMVDALERSDRASGKPWKGLARLYDLMVYSDVDPQSEAWDAAFAAAMSHGVAYLHVPGREWMVREYATGRHLLQLDGKIAPGDRWAGLQQGRSSLATGYLRGGQDRTSFGRRYSKPLAAFLDSMVVAEGADHQRQRKAFLPFLTPQAVLEHATFVESTVAHLLDEAARVASVHDGAFDLREQFAYRFPIRVICHVLGIPASDVPRVQHWAECAVRAMDTDAGVTFRIAQDGQQASDELRAYLTHALAAAHRGDLASEVLRALANDATLSNEERIANLGVLIFAGFETTTGLITKGTETLLRHRAQWDYLRAHLVDETAVIIDGVRVPDAEWRWLAWAKGKQERQVSVGRRDRLLHMVATSADAHNRFEAIAAQEAMLDCAVEELLRWTAPGTVVPLTASKDLDLSDVLTAATTASTALDAISAPAGQTTPSSKASGCPLHALTARFRIRRGETISVAVDELNRRCPVGAGVFAAASPEVFDVTRTENSAHLSFGLRHSCIGAFLAKENAKRALEALLRRCPDLALNGTPVPQEMELFSGLAALPVRSRDLCGTASQANTRQR